MSKKLVVTDGARERELQLVGRIVVGRDPACDITLDHALLSRKHAEFVTAGDLVVVRDLGSRNGVFVNGTKAAEQSLQPGDVVQIGPLRAEYVLDQAPLSIAPEDHDADRTRVMDPPSVVRTPPPVPIPSEDEEATRLITAPPISTGETVTGTLERPALDLGSERIERTQRIQGPGTGRRRVEPEFDLDRTAVDTVAAVAEAPASIRNFIFLQTLVLGGLVLMAAVISLRAGGAPAPLGSLLIPGIVVVVAGYLVSGVIDRRFSALAGSRRRP